MHELLAVSITMTRESGVQDGGLLRVILYFYVGAAYVMISRRGYIWVPLAAWK